MFGDFDLRLFEDPEFKEDSVREEIIAPILSRLGYSASGRNRIVRSKSLIHPFIYAGTRKLPIRMIPDYILKSNDRTLLVLDAKRPSEDVLGRQAVQQVYSYAIHPEVKSEHFALCNGKALAVFSIDKSDPLLILDFTQFDKSWEEIEKYLSPRMLQNPVLRQFAPDFGCALSRAGLEEGTDVHVLPAQFNLVAKLDETTMTATANAMFCGKEHCVSFDFNRDLLPQILSGLPVELAAAFTNALERSPFQAAAELAIELDLQTKLGPEVKVAHEVFRPLLITRVFASRLNLAALANEATDLPAHVFRLRKAAGL